MERLSIPLYRTHYTTRRTWRVVWYCVVLLILFSGISRAWYGRNTTAKIIPNDSVAVLRFSLNRSNQDTLRSLLTDFPIISGRALTFEDIKTSVQGEFSIFFLSDGTRAVSLRTEESLLPKTLLDSQGILVQKVNPYIFFLSSKLTPLTEIRLPKTSWLLSFHPFSKTIGTFSFKESDWISGGIYASSKKITIFFQPIQLSKHPFTSVPIETIGILSTPPSTSVSLDWLFRSTDRFLTQINSPTIGFLTSTFGKSKGGILLTGSEAGQPLNFLFATEEKLDPDQTKSLLKTATALKNPSLKLWELPDHTKTQEIIVDPSLISIEEYTAFGTTVLRATTPQNEHLFSTTTKQYLLLSNNEQLLRNWFQPESKKIKAICVGNHAFLSVKDTQKILSQGSTWIHPFIYFPFLKKYQSVGIEKTPFSFKIQLCQ